MTSSEIKFVPKSWGFERQIVNKPEYCGKELFFVKGRRCSLHYHKLKDETFYIQSGKLLILWSDQTEKCENDIFIPKEIEDSIKSYANPMFEASILNTVILDPGETFHIPQGRVHLMYALQDTSLFEFSTQHFDEDSYRIVKGD